LIGSAGCAEVEEEADEEDEIQVAVNIEDFGEPVLANTLNAGVPVSPVEVTYPGGLEIYDIVDVTAFGARSNPFGLLPEEASFEDSQETLRLFEAFGGFSMYYEPVEEEEDPVQFIPAPLWRLSGVLVEDGVLALLSTDQGTTQIVQPGTEIDGTGWEVVSIDTERAVIRRLDENIFPQTAEVPLQGQLPSAAPNQGGGAGGPGGPGGPMGRPGGPGAPPGMGGPAGGAGARDFER
jgi:hypothetical protein